MLFIRPFWTYFLKEKKNILYATLPKLLPAFDFTPK